MTVGKLRQLIERLSDDTPILCTGPDHSYRAPEVVVATAMAYGTGRNREWYEDFGEMNPVDEPDPGERIKAVIVR